MVIELSSIDKEAFDVRERGDRFLVTPKKSKFKWEENELHMRSLLLSKDGTVLSSGFPKFFNLGENEVHDAAFYKQLEVSPETMAWTEKKDGSLIICDRIDGKFHARTRGSDCLGIYEEPVMRLITEKYPQVIDFFKGSTTLGYIYSVLFEYTGPDNQIVLKYDAPDLTLIGAVNKATLEMDYRILDHLTTATGVSLPNRLGGLNKEFSMEAISLARMTTGIEGLVVTFDAGRKKLKIKSEEYVRLHSMKFRLEGKVAKLCFLLGAYTREDATLKLGELGIDFEAQEFIKEELNTYLRERKEAAYLLRVLSTQVKSFAANSPTRKNFVFRVQDFLEDHPHFSEDHKVWFGAAMLLYSGKELAAELSVISHCVLHDNPLTVRQWSPEDINKILSAPVPEE